MSPGIRFCPWLKTEASVKSRRTTGPVSNWAHKSVQRERKGERGERREREERGERREEREERGERAKGEKVDTRKGAFGMEDGRHMMI